MARPGKAGLFMEYISYTEAAECALHKLKEHPRNIQREKKHKKKYHTIKKKVHALVVK